MAQSTASPLNIFHLLRGRPLLVGRRFGTPRGKDLGCPLVLWRNSLSLSTLYILDQGFR